MFVRSDQPPQSSLSRSTFPSYPQAAGGVLNCFQNFSLLQSASGRWGILLKKKALTKIGKGHVYFFLGIKLLSRLLPILLLDYATPPQNHFQYRSSQSCSFLSRS